MRLAEDWRDSVHYGNDIRFGHGESDSRKDAVPQVERGDDEEGRQEGGHQAEGDHSLDAMHCASF